MFKDDRLDRRTVLRRAGIATLGSIALAGCSAPSGGDGGDDGNDDEDDGGTPTSSDPDLGGWLDGANNYDDTVADMTDSDTVTVEVGAGSTGLAFGPAAIRISTGTEVQFEWTGSGGGHNVHAMEGASFQSDIYIDSGVHFSHTFEESGTVKYRCDPHQSVMKGAVVVE